MGRIPISICFCLLFRLVDSQDFTWENDFIEKPTATGDWDGKTYHIPVIEGEIEEIQCQVRAEKEENYTLSLKYSQDFNANISNTISMGTPPDEYSVVDIILNIDNPEDIDDKKILCLKENSDAIYLVIRAFVRDPSLPCDPCNGTQYDKSTSIKLRRVGDQITEKEVEVSFFEKIRKKLGYTDNFYKVSDRFCGCRKKPEDSKSYLTILTVVVVLCIIGVCATFGLRKFFGCFAGRYPNTLTISSTGGAAEMCLGTYKKTCWTQNGKPMWKHCDTESFFFYDSEKSEWTVEFKNVRYIKSKEGGDDIPETGYKFDNGTEWVDDDTLEVKSNKITFIWSYESLLRDESER